MDITPYLELKIAPRAVFDRLGERKSRVRYMVPAPDGDWRAVTWGAHAKEIREVALFLATSGLAMGDRAAIFAGNRVEWMSAAMAIQAAGGVMVPVYPSSTAEQSAYVVRHCDAKVLFVDGAALLARVLERWDEMDAVRRIVLMDDGLDVARVLESLRTKGVVVPAAAEVDRRLVTWSRAIAMGRARDVEDPRAFERTMDAVSLDSPGLMLYTSGTSGPPKGVPLTHRNVGVNGRDWLECNAPLVREGAIDLLWLPMSHIFGFGEACLGNSLGWTSYLGDPATVLQRLPEVRPEVFMSVPSVWEKLAMRAMAASDPEARRVALREATGGALRFCLSGGAGLKREVKELFHAQGILLVEGYGLTEASPTLTLNRPDAFRFDSVGKPLPSVELRLAEDGEILARGASIFGGYHKDPAASAEAFTSDGWLKTGDVGRFTDDGFLQIIDRKKDILVTAGGKNIPPVNVEQRFADDPFFAHVVVYGDGKKYLVAGVWLQEEAVAAHLRAQGAAGEEAVRALVQQRIDRVNAALASYESIKKFVVVEEPLTVEGGLLTPTLKVKRKKVYEAFGDRFEALYS
ncbi:MAG: AMP-dependent synthetase/ligase [Myxococcota bacterium]|nr:AMP-dependent synthetase/ligase [Myxococcota bacterium]